MGLFSRFKSPRREGSDSAGCETEVVLIDSILDLSTQISRQQDTLAGKRSTEGKAQEYTKESLSAKSKKELEALREKLECQLEDLHLQARKSSRASFDGSPTQRSLKSGPGEDYWRLLGQDNDYGLRWDRRFSGKPSGPPDEKRRRDRREGTKSKVASELHLRHFGQEVQLSRHFQDVGRETWLYTDPLTGNSGNLRTETALPGGPNLLGRYDVLVTKVWADLDRDWEWLQKKNHFWVAHAAAINIGESMEAADFPDFSQAVNGDHFLQLDEHCYMEAMGRIMANICYAANSCQAEHLVFFPFGMGAFLRHLNRLDEKFAVWEEMQRLRRTIARTYLEAMATKLNGNVQIHLCLMFGAPDTDDMEPSFNADAFLRAVSDDTNPAIQAMKSRVTIYEEGDCLNVAQDLGGHSNKVVLVNGANRQLFGNHWFNGHAKRAIDENLHRRSWRMAATSYLLNNFGRPSGQWRKPTELQENVRNIGGTVIEIKG